MVLDDIVAQFEEARTSPECAERTLAMLVQYFKHEATRAAFGYEETQPLLDAGGVSATYVLRSTQAHIADRFTLAPKRVLTAAGAHRERLHSRCARCACMAAQNLSVVSHVR
jgi:hypothetical protein